MSWIRLKVNNNHGTHNHAQVSMRGDSNCLISSSCLERGHIMGTYQVYQQSYHLNVRLVTDKIASWERKPFSLLGWILMHPKRNEHDHYVSFHTAWLFACCSVLFCSNLILIRIWILSFGPRPPARPPYNRKHIAICRKLRFKYTVTNTKLSSYCSYQGSQLCINLRKRTSRLMKYNTIKLKISDPTN